MDKEGDTVDHGQVLDHFYYYHEYDYCYFTTTAMTHCNCCDERGKELRYRHRNMHNREHKRKVNRP